MSNIGSSATAALDAIRAGGQSEEDFSHDVCIIRTTSAASEDLPSLERKLISYYQSEKSEIAPGEIREYRDLKTSVYFMPLEEGALEDGQVTEGEGDLLAYINVSFDVNLVETTSLILAAAMILAASALYFASREVSKTLEAKEQETKRFFENASHELKTPLMAIQGYANGLSQGLIEEEKGLAIISEESEKMSSLVDTILQLSKIDSGMAVPSWETIDIREIVYDAVRIIEPLSKQKGISILISMPEPVITECDEDMLFSAISNVLTNGARYAISTIVIEATSDQSRASVRITNDGSRLTEEDAKRIFDRFYKGSGGQTGIGMALADEYMRLLGGCISSESNGDTTFVLSLPVQRHTR